MDPDDISNSVNDWEIFKSLGVEDERSIIITGISRFGCLEVERRIPDLKCADVSILVSFIGEGGVDDCCIEVLGFS